MFFLLKWFFIVVFIFNLGVVSQKYPDLTWGQKIKNVTEGLFEACDNFSLCKKLNESGIKKGEE